MSLVLHALEWLFAAYLVAYAVAYLVLDGLALRSILRARRLREARLPPPYPAFVPAVSILVAAYDEQATIRATVEALMRTDYPQFEVVVVNDGSGDATLAALVEAFELEPFPEAHWRRLDTRPVRAIYHSRLHANLRVFDKEHGGRADAFNVGINAALHPLFTALDGEWKACEGALHALVEPFLADPATVASLGATRVVDAGGSADARLLDALQASEHLRTAAFAPGASAEANALLGVPGSPGLFRKDAAVEAGGYRANTASNVELVMRLHGSLRLRRERYAIRFVAEPLAGIPPQRSLAGVAASRMARQRELCESLREHRALASSEGMAARAAFAFLVLFECAGPVIESAGYALIALAWLARAIPGRSFAALLELGFALGVLLSVTALVLDEASSHAHARAPGRGVPVIAAIVENLGYRQLVMAWRAAAVLRWIQARGAKASGSPAPGRQPRV